MSAKSSSPRLVARIVPNEPGNVPVARSTRGQRIGRRVSMLLAGLMMVFAASMGFAGGAAPAQAGPLDGIIDEMRKLMCFGEKDSAPSPNSSNAENAISGNRSPYDGSLKDKSVTAYEEFGTTGLFWSQYRPAKAGDNADGEAGCVTNKMEVLIGNFVANSTFAITNMITMVTTSMYLWAADGDLLDSFTDPLDCVIEGCNGGKGLKTTLFLNYLMPIVMMGALWGAWNGLVKKKTTETAQGGLWMVGATAFALLFMANPTLIANTANDGVNTVSTTIMNSVTGATSTSVAKDDMCWISGGSKQRGNRMAACSMYKAMLVTPWAAGQFGVPLGVEITSDAEANVGNRELTDMRVAQIDAQTVSQSELSSGDDFAEIKDADAERWDTIRAEVMGGKSKAAPMMWSGDTPSNRINIGFASLFASICLGFLVVVISFSTVVLAVSMILLIMMAPLFLLIGIHPGFGRGIALKWLELLIGTVFKRIVLSAMLAILVGMYQVILEQDMPWLSQVAMIMALGIGAIVFRKPMLETLNIINLGGSRTGMESGMGQSSKKATGAATGAGAGALAGAMAGGGVAGALGGAVKGGTMGSRSGSPVRAASMGSAAGRRAGTRKKVVRDAKKDAEILSKKRDAYWERGEPVPADVEKLINAHVKKWGEKVPLARPSANAERNAPDQRWASEDKPEKAGKSGAAPTATPPNSGGGTRPQARPTAPAAGGVPTAPPPAPARETTDEAVDEGPAMPKTGGGVPTRPPAPAGNGAKPANGEAAAPEASENGTGPKPGPKSTPPPRPQGR